MAAAAATAAAAAAVVAAAAAAAAAADALTLLFVGFSVYWEKFLAWVVSKNAVSYARASRLGILLPCVNIWAHTNAQIKTQEKQLGGGGDGVGVDKVCLGAPV